jgi:hypothetical protein
LAVQEASGSVSSELIRANDQQAKTVFAAAPQPFENKPKDDLIRDGKKEKSEAAQNDESPGKLGFAIEESSDHREDVSDGASGGDFFGFSTGGENSLRTREAEVIRNESPGDRGQNKKDHIGAQIKIDRQLENVAGSPSKVSRDCERASREQDYDQLQDQLYQIESKAKHS